MRSQRLFLLLLIINGSLFAQKNVVPASVSELLGIPLPEGTKRDKRLLVVAAAATLTESEARSVGLAESSTEVFLLPSSSVVAGNAILRSIEAAGWRIAQMAVNGYHRAVKDGRNIILFLETKDNGIDLYVSSCVPVAAPTPSAPLAEAVQSVPQTGSVKPTIPRGPTAAASISGGNVLPADHLGVWIKSGTMHYEQEWQPVKLGSGYIKDQYTFNADGTYSFLRKSVQYSDDKIILLRENGRYDVQGDQLTITPASSRTETWSKLNNTDKFSSLKASVDNKLEVVTYRYTMHYFTGIQEWNLVLQAGAPTLREGPFSTNTTYTNSWYFKKSSFNNPPLELPK